MYKSASEYLGHQANHLMEPYRHIEIQPTYMKENFHNTKPQTNNIESNNNNMSSTHPNLHWEKEKVVNLTDPRVWGPPYWFTLHVSAANYPHNPSPIFRERIKGRLLAIPFEIPCPGCKPHAAAFIEQNKHHLDEIVSSRESLVKFYVDFHNQVNERHGKRKWSYEEAKNFYSAGGTIERLKY